MNIEKAVAEINRALEQLEESIIPAAEKVGDNELVNKLCDVRMNLEVAALALQ